MKIVLISYGSRGDVQPYLALARGLRHVGHEARLVAPPTFAALAAEWRATQNHVRDSLDSIQLALGQAGRQYAETEAATARMFRG